MTDGKTIYHVEISEPPYFYDHKYSRPKEKDGKIVYHKRYYLNNNIFIGNNTHWKIQGDILKYAKDWLLPFFKDIPKISMCRIEMVYYSETDGWDIDNKAGFWYKVLMDILKVPTEKQKQKAFENRTWIRSVDAIKDDTVKYVHGISAMHQHGKHRMEIKIIERISTQTELF